MAGIVRGTLLGSLLVMSLLVTATLSAQERTLNVFNWSQYMDPEIIEAFEAEYDVTVVENYFNSNGEMFAKLRAGGDSQYDIIVPSNYYVPRLIETGLVQPLDHEQLPHLNNLLSTFVNPNFDPGNQYSVAYQWGTTGVVYNRAVLGDVEKSWSVLFDPEVNPDQPFAVPEDAQVVLGSVCAWLGYGYDCDARDELMQAAEVMLDTKQRGNFVGFVQGTPVLQQIARGSVHAGITFNGDFIFYKDEDPEAYADIEFMIPEEGAEVWVDNLMIPANAPNADLAHAFIDYLLRAEVAAQLSNWTYYASPNAAAQPMLDPILQEVPITPTPDEMEVLAFTPSLKGEELQFLQQLWREIEAR